MRLLVLSRYRSGAGSFEPGQVLELTDEVAEFLLRDSPGSFTADTEPNLDVVSTETISGVKAPDRRARGGQRR